METVAMPVMENGFGGLGNGGGVLGGGIVGYMLGAATGGGWFGGWGNRGNAVADASLGNAIEHIGDAVTQGTISQLQSSNALGMQMGGNTAAITGAITQGTINDLQSSANLNEKLCMINNNITTQGYESRLQSQALMAQLSAQHAELSAQIFKENCADRELVRDIQAQNVRDQLAQAQATNAALTAQINLSNQLQSQTLYLINQLKPAAAGA